MSVVIQLIPNQSNRRSMVQLYLNTLVYSCNENENVFITFVPGCPTEMSFKMRKTEKMVVASCSG
jgi:hypothetical protein